jgi:anthranilate synthase component 2
MASLSREFSMKLLILDNYDSFTYNLVHLVEKLSDHSFDVFKNDRIKLEDVAAYDKILLSPGPGIPSEAGIMPDLLKRYHKTKSIFGVCLGMQAIGETFQGKLKNLDHVFHGLATTIHVLEKDKIFENCPQEFKSGRYHSWVIDEAHPGNDIITTAVDDTGLIMAIRHKTLDIRGVQFHPESILSEYGETIIKNWLSL